MYYLRVRFQIIRNLETMHDCISHTFYVRALRIIWKRTRIIVCQYVRVKATHSAGIRLVSIFTSARRILPYSCTTQLLRVRLKIIGNLETMHDSDLPTFLIVSLPIIFKRTVE